LEKAMEGYGVKRMIGEILDYVRAIALDILPRKVMGEDVGRKGGED
jgi:DNA-directed RNA polymerase specialized sigma subunit